MTEISKEDARKRLETTVAEFNWIETFLGNQESFLRKYRALHEQLKEEDKLTIDIIPRTRAEKWHIDTRYVDFVVTLYRKDQKPKRVLSQNAESSVIVPDNLLYSD